MSGIQRMIRSVDAKGNEQFKKDGYREDLNQGVDIREEELGVSNVLFKCLAQENGRRAKEKNSSFLKRGIFHEFRGICSVQKTKGTQQDHHSVQLRWWRVDRSTRYKMELKERKSGCFFPVAICEYLISAEEKGRFLS